MFKKSVRIIIFVLFVLNFVPACFAEKQNIYHNEEGHFSFVIPEGWQEIPQEVIIEHNKKAVQYLKKSIPSRCRLPDGLIKEKVGFQKIGTEYCRPPSVHLWIDRDNDASGWQRYLKFYLKTKEYKKLKEKLKDKPNPTFLDFVQVGEFNYDDIGEEMYDANRHMLIRTYASFPIFKDVGRHLFIVVQALYKYGAVNISFQTTEKDLQNDLIYFREIISSFSFEEDYRYQEGKK